MAEEPKQQSSGMTGALPLTVVVAMLAGLIFTHVAPYHDERPSTQPLKTHYSYAQDVDARLWQDPLATVYGNSEEKVSIELNQNGNTQRINSIRSADNPPSHMPDQIYNGEIISPRDKIIILAITLPGGPYQEDAEYRMRRRYAVLSALANQGAVPQDEQHIGYFHPDPKVDIGLQKRVPFEWWSLPVGNKKVLLLWVDESSLREKPAEKIKELLCQVGQSKPSTTALDDYTVIGPNTSTLLLEMLKEVTGAKKINTVSKCTDKSAARVPHNALGSINGHEIVYFSAAATASDEPLLHDIMPTECKSITKCLGAKGMRLYRIAATDGALMDALVDELDARNVKNTGHIVILSEWDTYYGQSMPEAFKNAWNNHHMIEDKKVKPEPVNEKTVHVYGYMRGLDGKLPEPGDKVGSVTEKKADRKDKSATDALLEFPEGQSQKDYLRRLTDRILDLDQNLKDNSDRDGSPNGLAAFGVLGSDVHDKLMILEALRQYFPHKLFFTTDMDAAFIHPAKWHQTHNLLVASAFDLKLREELQGRIPSFRDSYQTSFFLAAQLIIQMKKADDKSIAEKIDLPLPRLFEIGRSHPIPLPTCKDTISTEHTSSTCYWTDWSACIPNQKRISLPRSCGIDLSPSLPFPLNLDSVSVSVKPTENSYDSECTWTNLEACNNTVQPAILSSSLLPWGLRSVIYGLILLLIVAIILNLVSWQVHSSWKPAMKYYKSHRFSVLCIGLTLFSAYCLVPLCWNNYLIRIDAEPFYWLEGVSIWPSQLLRLTIFPFAVVFFYWGHKRIRKMQEDLQVQEKPEAKQTFALPSEQERLKGCEVLFIGSWKQEETNQPVLFPAVLWKKYLSYCIQKKFKILPVSLIRVFVLVMSFFVMAFLVIRQSPPNVPARGDFAFIVNTVIIFIAVLSTQFLTMWVVENARLCERFIYHLSQKPSQWNGIAWAWAIDDNKVAPECASDWLDLQLVARLTSTIQPLIWGPVGCISLLVLARSPAIDDWGIPWGLGIVLFAMLLYALSAEILLQYGARSAREKAIKLLTERISEQRNLNTPDEVVIKRIESEIGRIRMLRTGAFKPWYDWPLLQSFGGLGTLVVAMQYFAGVWENGTF